MNKVECRYLQMLLLIRVREIKSLVKNKKNIKQEQLEALGGELTLINHILEELNKGDEEDGNKSANIQS